MPLPSTPGPLHILPSLLEHFWTLCGSLPLFFRSCPHVTISARPFLTTLLKDTAHDQAHASFPFLHGTFHQTHIPHSFYLLECFRTRRSCRVGGCPLPQPQDDPQGHDRCSLNTGGRNGCSASPLQPTPLGGWLSFLHSTRRLWCNQTPLNSSMEKGQSPIGQRWPSAAKPLRSSYLLLRQLSNLPPGHLFITETPLCSGSSISWSLYSDYFLSV